MDSSALIGRGREYRHMWCLCVVCAYGCVWYVCGVCLCLCPHVCISMCVHLHLYSCCAILCVTFGFSQEDNHQLRLLDLALLETKDPSNLPEKLSLYGITGNRKYSFCQSLRIVKSDEVPYHNQELKSQSQTSGNSNSSFS